MIRKKSNILYISSTDTLQNDRSRKFKNFDSFWHFFIRVVQIVQNHPHVVYERSTLYNTNFQVKMQYTMVNLPKPFDALCFHLDSVISVKRIFEAGKAKPKSPFSEAFIQQTIYTKPKGRIFPVKRDWKNLMEFYQNYLQGELKPT